MADIKVNGRIKLKTFQSQFCSKFPFLVPTLINKSGTRLNNDYTIAKCNSIVNGEYSPIKVEEFSINGNLLIGTFEKRFLENFGIPCEVVFRKGGKHYKTDAKYDKMSIAEANKLLETENAEKIVVDEIAAYA